MARIVDNFSSLSSSTGVRARAGDPATFRTKRIASHIASSTSRSMTLTGRVVHHLSRERAFHCKISVRAASGKAAPGGLIGVGLYIMGRAAKQRDAMHWGNMAQHREMMAALNAQREAQTEQRRETMKSLENQNEAMMELIRSTSVQGDG